MHGNRLRTVSCSLNSGKDRSLGAHLLVSNTRSGSDSQTVSTAPRRDRPRPEVRPLNWMPARFTGFHPLWWAAGHLGQPGKPGLQGGDGGGGGLGVWRWRGNRGRRRRWRSVGAQAGAPVACGGPAAARGHPAQLLGSLVEQEVGLLGHGVSLHTTDPLARAHKQVESGGGLQIVAMKRRWPDSFVGRLWGNGVRLIWCCGRKVPQKPGLRHGRAKWRP